MCTWSKTGGAGAGLWAVLRHVDGRYDTEVTPVDHVLNPARPFDRLIIEAAQLLRPHRIGDRLVGDVACVSPYWN